MLSAEHKEGSCARRVRRRGVGQSMRGTGERSTRAGEVFNAPAPTGEGDGVIPGDSDGRGGGGGHGRRGRHSRGLRVERNKAVHYRQS